MEKGNSFVVIRFQETEAIREQVKHAAANEGVTMSDWIRDAIRDRLDADALCGALEPVEWSEARSQGSA